MGAVLAKLFVDPTTLPGGSNCGGNHTLYHLTQPDDPLGCHESGFGFVQVLLLLGVYAYILFFGSNMISDGSELLLLVPSMRDIVGSVVLPILGAVPDGAIVLFSGLGKDAQKQLSVGVGALAGSTIMLLTVPWFLSVLAGRVDLDRNGVPNYRKAANADSKLTVKGVHALTHSAVSLSPEIALGAKIMLATAVSYFVIQIPAFEMIHKYGDNDPSREAHGVHNASLAGLILCVCAFVAYLWYQVKYANLDDAVQRVKEAAIGQRLITLSGAFAMELEKVSSSSHLSMEADESTGLVNKSVDALGDFLQKYFNKFDVDGNGKIDQDELVLLFRDLNENLTKEQQAELMKDMDKDNSGTIDFEEFVSAMIKYIKHSGSLSQEHMDRISPRATTPSEGKDGSVQEEGEEGDGGEEEEEEVPEEFQHLTPKQQQRAIKIRSAWMMALGTAIVLLFSDPMVDVLDNLGERMDIPPFYVAFVLAPLASNAAELIAAYNYAMKKTRKTIGISIATLEGAAIMNNTFCLGIFLLIIYAKDLAWQFSAETISIFAIQLFMFFMAHMKKHTLLTGIIIICFYPLSLLAVALMEGPGHLD